MAEYKVGQKVLIRTSYRADDKFVLAGRPGVIVDRIGGSWPKYQIEVQMPDGPYAMETHQTKREGGFVIDTPQNRIKYPVPDWNQVDLRELHWPQLMKPLGIRVNGNSFDGFIGKIAEACGGIKTDHGIASVTYSWGSLEYGEAVQYIFPSSARVKAFWELLRWVDWDGRAKYKAGVEAGQNLLVQMARGELTPAMFEQEVYDKTRMESYHQHVWKHIL